MKMLRASGGGVVGKLRVRGLGIGGSKYACMGPNCQYYPKGPSTQKLGTWILRNNNCSAALGGVYEH